MSTYPDDASIGLGRWEPLSCNACHVILTSPTSTRTTRSTIVKKLPRCLAKQPAKASEGFRRKVIRSELGNEASSRAILDHWWLEAMLQGLKLLKKYKPFDKADAMTYRLYSKLFGFQYTIYKYKLLTLQLRTQQYCATFTHDERSTPLVRMLSHKLCSIPPTSSRVDAAESFQAIRTSSAAELEYRYRAKPWLPSSFD